MRVLAVFVFGAAGFAATVPFDSSAYTSGAVRLSYTVDEVAVMWPDESGKTWSARFSLDPSKPLITGVSKGATTVLNQASPIYRAGTGRRRGGWDQFFDFPESAPEGTRRFQGEFKLTRGSATSDGNRLVLTFEGLRLGIFSGSIQYIFYPGGSLVQQRALVSTSKPDTAFYYEAGLRMDSPKDRRPGGNMDSAVSFYDTTGVIRTVASSGPRGSRRKCGTVQLQRHPPRARWRCFLLRTVFSSRLHDQSWVCVAQHVARQRVNRDSTIAGRQLAVLSVVQRAPRHATGTRHVSVVKRGVPTADALDSVKLYTHGRLVSRSARLQDVRAPLASGVHGAGNCKGQAVGSAFPDRAARHGNQHRHDHGLSR